MAGIFDFTLIEVRDIAISLLVLGFVFAYPIVLENPFFIIYSLLWVGIAFVGHELSHRFVARKLGFYSAYRMWPEGLVLALVLAFATGGGFVFAAPGAVVFSSYWILRNPNIRDIGLIGIAGTVFNICVMYLSLSLYFLTGIQLLSFMARINGWLALFNLIPFGPLDGKKVMAWNMKAWVAALALALAGFLTLLVF